MTPRASIALVALLMPACTDGPRTLAFEARIVRRDASSPCAEQAHAAADDDRCRCSIDCLEGAACLPEADFGIPGGACMRGCSSDGDCGAGSTCGTLAGLPVSICRRNCETTADCSAGRLCMFPSATATERVCLHGCSSDADCESGACDLYRGLCNGAATTGGRTLERCIQDDECRSGWCAQPGGFCLSGCSISAGACPDDAVCVEDATPGDDGGVCLPRCFRQSDCGDAAPIRCALTTVGASTVQVCIPESAVMR